MTTILPHQHAILLCACGRILSQCRCLAPEKRRQVVAQECSACRRTPVLTFPLSTFVWDDAPQPLLRCIVGYDGREGGLHFSSHGEEPSA